MEPKRIRKVGLVLVKDKKVIMLRKHSNEEVFYFAGGKTEQGESDIQCLKRELMEELLVTLDEASTAFLAEFEAPAHGQENTIVSIRLYSATVQGEPTPNREIAELRYFNSMSDPRYLSALALDQAFPWLKDHGYID